MNLGKYTLSLQGNLNQQLQFPVLKQMDQGEPFDQQNYQNIQHEIDQQFADLQVEVVEDQGQQQQISNTNNNQGPKKNQVMPKEFNKAKRTLTKLVNEYFSGLKKEIIASNGAAKFIYCQQFLQIVQSALAKLATIRYTNLNDLAPKKPEIVEDFLLSYLPQSKKIIKYNANICNNNSQKPREVFIVNEQNLQLPDCGTPAAFGGNSYFFDGSKFDFQRMVYVPIEANYKVNLITGHISKLEAQPPFFRMKCCILKVKHGFFILGGYAGNSKILTKKCTFYEIKSQKFYQLASLNLFHKCPTGCLHSGKVYVFSGNGAQIFNDNQNCWSVIQTPKRLKFIPFQYCHSVSQNQILIIGGKMCDNNSTNLKIYNTETNQVSQYSDVLPVGVSNERAWGPMIINGFVTVMSTIQASLIPQMTVKKDAIQLVLIGHGGCFLNTLIC